VAANCAGCHGANGLSANPEWPNLAGQNTGYLVASLNAFKDGSRNHRVMTSVAKTLGDADIENLAAYYAGVSCK
jgi:cytochrome c553